MLAIENFCNLKRLAFVTSTSKKAKSRVSCNIFLVAATDALTTTVAVTMSVTIISRSVATNGSSSTMRMRNIFMDRSLGGRLTESRFNPYARKSFPLLRIPYSLPLSSSIFNKTGEARFIDNVTITTSGQFNFGVGRIN